jgi:hypothetical protein
MLVVADGRVIFFSCGSAGVVSVCASEVEASFPIPWRTHPRPSVAPRPQHSAVSRSRARRQRRSSPSLPCLHLRTYSTWRHWPVNPDMAYPGDRAVCHRDRGIGDLFSRSESEREKISSRMATPGRSVRAAGWFQLHTISSPPGIIAATCPRRAKQRNATSWIQCLISSQDVENRPSDRPIFYGIDCDRFVFAVTDWFSVSHFQDEACERRIGSILY